MAAIPYSGVGGDISPGTISIPNDYQNVQANPAAFGAATGQAEQRLGQGAEQLGSGLMVLQAYQNRNAVTNAFSAAQNSALDVQYNTSGTPGNVGFYGLKGQQAIDAFPQARQQVLDAYQAARNGLQNPAQKALYDQETRRTMFGTLGTMGQHYANQVQVSAVGASQSAAALAQQGAVLASSNDPLFQSQLDLGKQHVMAAAAQQGLPAETAQLQVQDYESKTWAQRALHIGQTNPQAGLDVLTAAGDKVDLATQDMVTRTLQPRAKQNDAFSVAEQNVGAVARPGAGAVAPVPPEQQAGILQTATAGTMVPPALLNAVITQESGWDAGKQRPGGTDLGLGQITASTGADPGYDGVQPISRQDVLDPQKNATWSAHYLEARGKALGLTSPQDWQDPSKVSMALHAYNGGGDPQYAQHVLARMGPQSGAPGALPGSPTAGQPVQPSGSGPTQPVQTIADSYRTNYDAVPQKTHDDLTAKYPDDPQTVELGVAHAQQMMNQGIQQQKQSYQADDNLLWQAANGDLNKGIAPGSVDQLTAVSPAVAQAWQRVQVQQPQLAHSLATRVLSQAAQPDQDKDAQTYGNAFDSVFARIHAADGDPNKITDPDSLYPMLGQPNGLTMAGIAKLRGEITSRTTPEGEAEAAMRAQLFKTARSQISGKNPVLNIPDPIGQANMLRFQAQAYPAIAAAKAKGLTPAQIYNPDSPDYVGKIIPSFVRTPAQKIADMNAASLAVGLGGPASPAAEAQAPGLFGSAVDFVGRMFGASQPTDFTTREGIRSAYQAGKITRQEGIARLLALPSAAPAASAPPTAPGLPATVDLVPTTD